MTWRRARRSRAAVYTDASEEQENRRSQTSSWLRGARGESALALQQSPCGRKRRAFRAKPQRTILRGSAIMVPSGMAVRKRQMSEVTEALVRSWEELLAIEQYLDVGDPFRGPPYIFR